METSMRWRAGTTLVSILCFASMARAASINYGNFGPVPPGIGFLQVIESSSTDAVPLYGPPSPFPIGLDFNPIGFGSNSSGGSADITEGQLNFTVSGNVNGVNLVEISFINLFESGDYTLAGAGTAATSVFAGAIMRATVTEVNGLAVAPINLVPVNASVGFSLPPPIVAAPWSLGLGLNVQGQVPGATKVEIVINNTLTSSSESTTASSIAKKDFQIEVTPGFVIVIPEPGSIALAGAVLCGLCVRSRRSGQVS